MRKFNIWWQDCGAEVCCGVFVFSMAVVFLMMTCRPFVW